jgi:hypothetical protein
MDAEVARIKSADKLDATHRSSFEIAGDTPTCQPGNTISNLYRLVDWSNQWTRRIRTPRPYPASTAPTDEESVPVLAETRAANEKRRNLNL